MSSGSLDLATIDEPGAGLTRTPEPGVVPYATRRSIFARYVRSTGISSSALMAAGCLGACLVSAAGLASLGPLAAVAAAALGASGAFALVNTLALRGNAELREELRRALGLDSRSEDAMEFVGLCRGDNNSIRAKYLSFRFDTDDNVGFLELGERELRLYTEENPIVIPRGELRQVSLERVIEYPVLRWVRIEFYQGDSTHSFLLMSRDADSLRQQRRATLRLHERIVDWHTREQLRWLEEERD